MKLFDSHTHLDRTTYGDELESVIERALAAGVASMVTIGAGETLDIARDAVALAESYDAIWATVGIHPHHADQYSAETMAAIEELATRSERVVALGEMGLDFHYDFHPKEVQEVAFEAQIRLAQRLELPIVIHSRSAEAECIELLDRVGLPERRGIFHCYTGDLSNALAALDRGFWISVPGIITFKKADEMRDLIRELPLERLLIETDAPYLTPHPFRGKRNEPMRITHTAEKLAEIKGISPDELGEITSRNARRAYFLESS